MTGFEALDAHVHQASGGAEILHALDPMRAIPFDNGGPPLQSVAVYRCEGVVGPHWHFVTFGLSEMGGPEDEAAKPVFDFELTFRLKASEEEKPPQWPVLLMRGLARYVLSTGRAVAPGDTFGNGAPLTHVTGDNPYEEVTDLSELVFGEDPGLDALETPAREVRFIQAFGITAEEFVAAQSWSGARFWELLSERNPMMVTDLWRQSYLEDEEIREAIDEGIDEEGSTLGIATVPGANWEKHPDGKRVTINVPVAYLDHLERMLRGRIAHGREFYLTSEREISGEVVRFQAGEKPNWHVDPERGYLVVVLDPELVPALIDDLDAEHEGYVALPGVDADLWLG